MHEFESTNAQFNFFQAYVLYVITIKKESKIKMTKTIEWYEDAFLEFHLTAGKKAVSASTFPLFKDLKKNYHLKSMINKISDVQPSLYIRLAMGFNL